MWKMKPKNPPKNQPKSKTLQETKDLVSNAIFGTTKDVAVAANTCISCKGKAESFRDSVSLCEYKISALCQSCQDKVFGGH